MVRSWLVIALSTSFPRDKLHHRRLEESVYLGSMKSRTVTDIASSLEASAFRAAIFHLCYKAVFMNVIVRMWVVAALLLTTNRPV